MLPKVRIAGVFGVLAGLSVSVGCGTSNYKSNAETFADAEADFRAQFEAPASVDAEARAMVGKPVEAALERLGPPTHSEDGLYTWDRTSYHTFRTTEFQQTGTDCNQQVIGMTRGGNGAAPAPIQRTTCTPIGREAEVEKRGVGSPSALCIISADTDANGIITKFDLAGCASGF